MKLIRERKGGLVVAHVKGHSDTHVLFDLVVGKSPALKNMSRPIGPFMRDYGLV